MDPFVAEIRIFGCNFAPTGWAQCSGQILPISQNTALFSLLGTTYGGNGQSNFALPNLQGRAAMHVGNNPPGPGLSLRDLGEMSGTETVTLLPTEMPVHTHVISTRVATGTNALPAGNVWGTVSTRRPALNFYSLGASTRTMGLQAISSAGSNLPHNNLMPYLVLNYCIAMQGVYPPRS